MSVKSRDRAVVVAAVGAAFVGAIGVVIAAVISSQSGHSNSPIGSPSAVIESPSKSTSIAQLRASDCRTLTEEALKEASALAKLQNTIQLDAPTSRITGHTSGYERAYYQTLALVNSITTVEHRYKNDGQKITTDSHLDGDLNQLRTDLPNLNNAVSHDGIGGSEWNQLTAYHNNFLTLSTMKCS
jgi:hypothetical protein